MLQFPCQRSWMCGQRNVPQTQWSFWTQTTLFLLSFNTLGWVRQVPLGSKISCTRCQLATALHQLALFKLLQHKDWHTPSLHPSTFTMRKRYYFLLIKQAQTSKGPLQSLCPLTGYCKNDHRLTLTKIKSSWPLHTADSSPWKGLTSHRGAPWGAPYSFVAPWTFFLDQCSASPKACIVRMIFPSIHYSVFIITESYLQFCHPFNQYFKLSATLHNQP